MKDKRCGTCKWFEPQRGPKGGAMRSLPGKCVFDIEPISSEMITEWAKLPAVYREPINRIFWESPAWPDYGTDCPQWEPKR